MTPIRSSAVDITPGRIVPGWQSVAPAPRAFGKTRAKTGVAEHARKGRGQRRRVSNGNQQPGVIAHQIRNRTGHRGDDREPVRQRFGDGHSVGLLLRGEDDDIRPVVARGQRTTIEIADE